MRVFIAHSASDRDLVSVLAGLLRASGDTVFIHTEMAAGENVLSQISAAIRSADVLVAILNSSNPNIFYELGLATGASVATLIAAPVAAPLPANLASMPYVQLTGDPARDCQAIARRVQESGIRSPSESAKFDSAEAALKAAVQNPAVLESLSPVTFEHLVMVFFRERGYAVTEDRLDDSGADFVIQSDATGHRVLVQVKKVSAQSRVSVDSVRKFLSAVSDADALGMLVATSDYTAAALDLAAGSRVILRTLEQILQAESEESLLETGSRGLAASLLGIAAAWAKKGHTDKAIEYYEKAVDLNEEIGDERGQTSAYRGLAAALMKMGDFPRAIQYFERALELNEVIGDRRAQASAYRGFADALMKMGGAHRAIEYYERAVELSEMIGDRRAQASAYRGFADALMKMGNAQRAIEYYRRAVELNEVIGDRRAQVSAYSDFADALMKMGDAHRAIEYYERAVELNEVIGDRRAQASAYSGFADALMKMGDADRAIEYYERAVSLQRKTGDGYGLKASLDDIERARATKGELKQ